MNKKTLLIVTYSSITKDRQRYCVNRALGSLTDSLSKYFKKIYYVGSRAHSDLYVNGASVYSYHIKSRNVAIAEISSTGLINRLLKRMIITIKNQLYLKSVMNKVDLVFVFLPCYTGLLATFMAKFYRKKYVLYVGSNWRETGSLRLRKLDNLVVVKECLSEIYSLLEILAVKSATFCLVAGKKLLNDYSELNKLTYAAVPMVQFKNATNYKNIRGRIKYNSVKILYVGPITENKGINYLVAAVPLLNIANIKPEVCLVGTIDESYKVKLDDYIVANNLNEQIHYVGYISDVSRLEQCYLKSDIFITPTLGEGFPRVIYEAMLCGLPVIATNIDSIRENMCDNEIATLIQPCNSQSIANAVIELWRDRKLRQNRIKKGRVFAEKLLQGNSAEQLIDLMKKHSLL